MNHKNVRKFFINFVRKFLNDLRVVYKEIFFLFLRDFKCELMLTINYFSTFELSVLDNFFFINCIVNVVIFI